MAVRDRLEVAIDVGSGGLAVATTVVEYMAPVFFKFERARLSHDASLAGVTNRGGFVTIGALVEVRTKFRDTKLVVI
jgi:hypothetical protein